ncbi:unnamed protein product [Malus baccata var. baccata]
MVEQKNLVARRVENANGKASKRGGAEVLSMSKEVSARRLSVMQQLGLIAPLGSSFHKKWTNLSLLLGVMLDFKFGT